MLRVSPFFYSLIVILLLQLQLKAETYAQERVFGTKAPKSTIDATEETSEAAANIAVDPAVTSSGTDVDMGEAGPKTGEV